MMVMMNWCSICSMIIMLGMFDVCCSIFHVRYMRYDAGTYNYVSGGPMWCGAVEFAAGRSAECWGRSDMVCVGIM